MMTLITLKVRPSIYALNNFFDIVLFILNTAYSIVPILARYDIKTPDSVMIVLSLLLLIVPIVATVLFVYKSFIGKSSEDDPRAAKLTAEDKEDDDDDDDEKKKSKKSKRKNDPEDIYNFTYQSLMPLCECPKTSIFSDSAQVGSVPQQNTFGINKYKISKKMALMHETIDIAIDNSTIVFLSMVLLVTVVFATAGFGWYIGVLIPYYHQGIHDCSSL